MLCTREALGALAIKRAPNSCPFQPIAVGRLQSLVYLTLRTRMTTFILSRFQDTLSRLRATANPREWQAVKMPRTRCAKDTWPRARMAIG